ncbi:TetR/AcrR family transcriptional regulator [Actinomycetospora sp. CA-084318]|uniref:TetR/AcrR family transcriptional regulator n=1 Tax=Actinomycetospora sp. CA-084318 TaxID=3239892 RepID=UPI003D974572
MTADPAPVRRQRLSEDERRSQILAATIAVVAGQGYEQASLARIAEQAGVSKGLVSHYFGSKEDLMALAAREAVRIVREAVAAELDLAAPVPEVVRSALRRAAHLRTTHREPVAALAGILANLRSPDGSPRLSLADYEDSYRAQEVLFRRGQAEGTLRPLDPRVMAVTYQGAIDSMLGYAEAHPDTDLDRYADTLADLLLGGFGV